jgi:hypothetical protein
MPVLAIAEQPRPACRPCRPVSAENQEDDREVCDLASESACNHGVQMIAALAVCDVCVFVTVQTAVPPSADEQADVVATL